MNKPGVLSKRELQVAELVAWGAKKSEIAEMLFIAEDTVENHVRNIYSTLGIHSIGELSSWWFCTHFHISFSLSPLKRKIVALALLAIIIPAELMSSDSFIRPSRTRVSRTFRPVGRRSKKELDLSDIFI